jgi:hypothetical protein
MRNMTASQELYELTHTQRTLEAIRRSESDRKSRSYPEDPYGIHPAFTRAERGTMLGMGLAIKLVSGIFAILVVVEFFKRVFRD